MMSLISLLSSTTIAIDPTLTLANLLTALEEVPSKHWGNLNDWLGVPESVQDRIEEQCSDDDQYKRESLLYWLHNYPVPSWKGVVGALFIIGEFRALKEVERKYLKSEAVCGSLVPRPPRFFCSSVCIDNNIIHGCGRAATQTEEQRKGGRPGNEAVCVVPCYFLVHKILYSRGDT